jgi:hypothetical protein
MIAGKPRYGIRRRIVGRRKASIIEERFCSTIRRFFQKVQNRRWWE